MREAEEEEDANAPMTFYFGTPRVCLGVWCSVDRGQYGQVVSGADDLNCREPKAECRVLTCSNLLLHINLQGGLLNVFALVFAVENLWVASHPRSLVR